MPPIRHPGVQEPNPSVITLNAVAAAHAVNDFLFDFLGLRAPEGPTKYQPFCASVVVVLHSNLSFVRFNDCPNNRKTHSHSVLLR